MEPMIETRLQLPKNLYLRLEKAAIANRRTIEEEITEVLRKRFEQKEEAMTDSTLALAAVGVALGIQ